MRLLPLFLLLALGLNAQSPSLKALSNQFQTLAEATNHAVVEIITLGFAPEGKEDSALVRTSRGAGSGVLLSEDGYIVTNSHVVASARRIQVLVPQHSSQRAASVLKPAGKLYPARVLGVDRETDIAVLKIEESKLPFLQFGDSELLRQGQLVLAFGSPLGLQNSVSMGIVSSTARQVRPDDPMIYIQTDAAINPGNSGGPLVNTDGHVVGINTFILTQSGGSEGIGFAAPSNIVKSVYEQIRQFGRVRRGQIGVSVQTINPLLAKALDLGRDEGVLIDDVASQSAAAAAGIEIKDIILSLNGKKMENSRQFGVNIYQNAGKTVELEVLRGTEAKKISVAVLERPQDPDRIGTLVAGDENRFRKLGILAVELDERVTPLLPAMRKFTGVVVAGVTSDLAVDGNRLQPGDVIHEVSGKNVLNLLNLRQILDTLPRGSLVALQIERMGQYQFLLSEID